MPRAQKTKPIRVINTYPMSKSRKKRSRLIVWQQIKERPDSERRQRVSTQGASIRQDEVDIDEENNVMFTDDEDLFGQGPTASRSPFRSTGSQSTSIVNLGAGNIDPFRMYPSQVPSATVNKCISYCKYVGRVPAYVVLIHVSQHYHSSCLI